MRFVIAGLNGLMFAFGLYVVLEHIKFRPDRLRKRLKKLIIEAESADIAGTLDEEKLEIANQKREEIEEIKKMLGWFPQNKATMMRVSFGMLMIAVSIMSLLSLSLPSFRMFM